MLSSESAAQQLRQRVASRQATSVLRIGDGEGVVLHGTSLDDALPAAYVQTHFGEQLGQDSLDRLVPMLWTATRRAWLLGIRADVLSGNPGPEALELPPDELIRHVQAHFPLRSAESERLDYESAYRLVTLNRVMAAPAFFGDGQIVSAWCHFDWLESGLLADLIATERNIGLVCGREELACVLRRFDINVNYWPVPLRYLSRQDNWTPHFPDRFDELVDTLTVEYPGQVFLVGAGICGKVYCDLIAERGGIAIDIGSVCDAWLGIASRLLVAQTRWGQETVPDTLLLKRQLEARLGPAASSQKADG